MATKEDRSNGTMNKKAAGSGGGKNPPMKPTGPGTGGGKGGKRGGDCK